MDTRRVALAVEVEHLPFPLRQAAQRREEGFWVWRHRAPPRCSQLQARLSVPVRCSIPRSYAVVASWWAQDWEGGSIGGA